MLFSDCPMPVPSDKINFDSFLKTLKIYAPKIPMKYSQKGQNFAMSNITIDVLFEICWTPYKKPHLSSWSRTRFTFFWSTPYLLHLVWFSPLPVFIPSDIFLFIQRAWFFRFRFLYRKYILSILPRCHLFCFSNVISVHSGAKHPRIGT